MRGREGGDETLNNESLNKESLNKESLNNETWGREGREGVADSSWS